jgi:hypothetical protein
MDKLPAFAIMIVLLSMVLLPAFPAFAADIAFDSASGSAVSAGGNSINWVHTIGGQPNRILVVGVQVEHWDAANAVVSSVTYNGAPLSRAESQIVGTATFMNVELWYLLEAGLPPAGDATVLVTTTGVVGHVTAGAISLYNVDQAGPEATATSTDGESGATGLTTSITTLTDGAWVVDAIGSGNGGISFTPLQGGQTSRYNQSADSCSGAGSTKFVATAGVTNMQWEALGSNRLSHVLAAFAPAVSEPVELADHDAGQEIDNFNFPGTILGADLFAFRLRNNGGNTENVTEIVFPLSQVAGIAQSDFANLSIHVDDNGDGTIDGSDVTGTVGGAGVVDAGVTGITFSTAINLTAGSTTNFILKGDVSNLVDGNQLTIDLGQHNITLTSGAVGGMDATSINHVVFLETY